MTSTAIQTTAEQTPLPTFTPRADIVAIESVDGRRAASRRNARQAGPSMLWWAPP